MSSRTYESNVSAPHPQTHVTHPINTSAHASSSGGTARPYHALTLGLRRNEVVRVKDSWQHQCERILRGFEAAQVDKDRTRKRRPVSPWFWDPTAHACFTDLITAYAAHLKENHDPPKEPIWFKTVSLKLHAGKYESPSAFTVDFLAVIQNSIDFFLSPGCPESADPETLLFEARELYDNFTPLYDQVIWGKRLCMGTSAIESPMPAFDDLGFQAPLSENVRRHCIKHFSELDDGQHERVIEFLKSAMHLDKDADDNFSLDIQRLPPRVQWDLYNLVECEYALKMGKTWAKKTVNSMNRHNVVGKQSSDTVWAAPSFPQEEGGENHPLQPLNKPRPQELQQQHENRAPNHVPTHRQKPYEENHREPGATRVLPHHDHYLYASQHQHSNNSTCAPAVNPHSSSSHALVLHPSSREKHSGKGEPSLKERSGHQVDFQATPKTRALHDVEHDELSLPPTPRNGWSMLDEADLVLAELEGTTLFCPSDTLPEDSSSSYDLPGTSAVGAPTISANHDAFLASGSSIPMSHHWAWTSAPSGADPWVGSHHWAWDSSLPSGAHAGAAASSGSWGMYPDFYSQSSSHVLFETSSSGAYDPLSTASAFPSTTSGTATQVPAPHSAFPTTSGSRMYPDVFGF